MAKELKQKRDMISEIAWKLIGTVLNGSEIGGKTCMPMYPKMSLSFTHNASTIQIKLFPCTDQVQLMI